jgi:hypothetical protein
MNASALTASPAWSAAGWTMLHLLWVGAILGLLAAMVRGLTRSARPEVRYGLALVCLGALTFAPVAIFAMASTTRSSRPRWRFSPDCRPSPETASGLPRV